jgi:predicted CoA-binding protein
MPAAISEHPPLLVPVRSRKPLTRVARWTLYVAGAAAIVLGLGVWPAGVRALGNLHTLAGWLVIASLWTLAAISARAGVARSLVWISVGWGVATTLGALAQYQLPAGSWITLLHGVTGVGAIAFGQTLVSRTRAAERQAMRLVGPAEAARSIEEAAAEFLANRRIAVTGVSRTPGEHGSNVVYRRLRERGYEVFAVNPSTDRVEGDRAYPDLRSIPGGVDAVVIATRPDHAMGAIQECAALGIRHVWMHRAFGAGSVSEEAAAWGRENGLRVIAGGCPLMFSPVSDTGHVMMRSLLTLTHKVPRTV